MARRRGGARRLCTILLALGLAGPFEGRAAEPTLRPALQAALIAKLLQADSALGGDTLDTSRLIILELPGQKAVNDAFEAAFKPTGVQVERVTVEQLSQVRGGKVLYVSGDEVPAPVNAFCASNGILSISPNVQLARLGSVAVGLGVDESGKPLIIVSKRRISAEKHSFSTAIGKYLREVD